MRHLLKVIVAIFLASCINKSHNDPVATLPDNSKLVTTILRDSLGEVSFSIPDRYDTSFTWTNHSDCGKPCDHEEYRFQSRSYPIFMESGFYYDIPNILVDQFTIIHSSYFPFHALMDTSKNSLRHEYFKNKISSDLYNGHIKFDTIEKINGRYFSIICITGFDTTRQNYFSKVVALTTVKGNEIEFHYDINSTDTTNEKAFFDNSIKFIKTIRMSNGI
jgi:hypothetical protein